MTIINIREAAWLTDNTYKYEEVVRMMGDVIAALRGDLRVSCACARDCVREMESCVWRQG